MTLAALLDEDLESVVCERFSQLLHDVWGVYTVVLKRRVPLDDRARLDRDLIFERVAPDGDEGGQVAFPIPHVVRVHVGYFYALMLHYAPAIDHALIVPAKIEGWLYPKLGS